MFRFAQHDSAVCGMSSKPLSWIFSSASRTNYFVDGVHSPPRE
jgi:hypothetical protein